MAADGDAHYNGQRRKGGLSYSRFTHFGFITISPQHRPLQYNDSCPCAQQLSCPLWNPKVQYYFTTAHHRSLPEPDDSC